MKYVIEAIEVETCPDKWTSKDSWPGPGVYKVKNEGSTLYHVHDYGVNYISNCDDMLKQPYQEPGETVSELLLLKLVAAAGQASVLKGAA